jgi:hypothetical protein
MFDGLSKREVIGWIFCLALAVALTLFGSAYYVTSLISADVSDALVKHPAPLHVSPP